MILCVRQANKIGFNKKWLHQLWMQHEYSYGSLSRNGHACWGILKISPRIWKMLQLVKLSAIPYISQLCFLRPSRRTVIIHISEWDPEIV